ncbi:hypothetical protein, partial [Pseudomonas sp. Sample_9]|uniref:hypothetical protein n=1 Tax=Pseudomonas sp. Sample_9 TaxID=2382158 RepID=UPI0019D5EC77
QLSQPDEQLLGADAAEVSVKSKAKACLESRLFAFSTERRSSIVGHLSRLGISHAQVHIF